MANLHATTWLSSQSLPKEIGREQNRFAKLQKNEFTQSSIVPESTSGNKSSFKFHPNFQNRCHVQAKFVLGWGITNPYVGLLFITDRSVVYMLKIVCLLFFHLYATEMVMTPAQEEY